MRSYKQKEVAHAAETVLTGSMQLDLCSCYPTWLHLLPGLFLNPNTINCSLTELQRTGPCNKIQRMSHFYGENAFAIEESIILGSASQIS